jgi:phosphatidylethanolamine/phosphatidyl-N-methylethanolamine N-methyltransferase
VKSLLAFWGEFLRNPRDVGSVIPSSQMLGTAVAREVLSSKPGYVIEIGAGTGSITHSLVQIRNHLTELIVIEKSEKLAKVLSQRYANVKVNAGCASQLSEMHIPDDQPLTIVSSLPFRSLPHHELEIIRELIGNLGKRKVAFRFIQYSYFGRLPFMNKVSWLTWERKRTVFANIPPATIWVLGNKTNKAKLSH